MRKQPNPRCRAELDALLSAYCDGRLDHDGEQRLTELLESDREARRYYLHFLDLHLDLARRGSTLASLPPPRHQPLTLAKILLPVAAALALAAVAIALLNSPGDPVTGVGTLEPAAAALADGPVAFVSRAESVAWDYPAAAQAGLELDSGDAIELSAGSLRLDFFDGSSATIEAPARFILFSSTEMELLSGRIVVRSDGPTPGFAVRTPSAVFVDVGTEFALSVIDSVETQMRVTEGEVIATLLSDDDVALDERSAFAGESLRVDPLKGISAADLDPAEFPQMLAPSALPLRLPANYPAVVLADKPLGYWRFEELSAGGVANQIDAEQVAISLGTPRLEGTLGGNRTLVLEGDESGRGLFVAAPLHGFPTGEYTVELWINAQSLQHSGILSLLETDTDSLEEAMKRPPQHRMMALESTSGERSRWSRAPQGKLSFSHRRRGGIGRDQPGEPGEPDEPDRGKRGWTGSKRHDPGQGAKWNGNRRADWKNPNHSHFNGGHRPHEHEAHRGRFSGGSRDFESRVYSDKRYIPGTWHHVVAVREKERILLYLDGELESETEAAAAEGSIELQVIIGRYSLASGWLGRPFYGRVDELAIYDRALGARDVRRHAGVGD